MNHYTVVLSRLAEVDLIEIVNYLESRSRKLAVDLYVKLKGRVLELANSPERGRRVPELDRQGIEHYRELIEGNYRIIYSISSDNVLVHAIVDSRRNLEEVLIKKLILSQES